jgi:hypothetical protein
MLAAPHSSPRWHGHEKRSPQLQTVGLSVGNVSGDSLYGGHAKDGTKYTNNVMESRPFYAHTWPTTTPSRQLSAASTTSSTATAHGQNGHSSIPARLRRLAGRFGLFRIFWRSTTLLARDYHTNHEKDTENSNDADGNRVHLLQKY